MCTCLGIQYSNMNSGVSIFLPRSESCLNQDLQDSRIFRMRVPIEVSNPSHCKYQKLDTRVHEKLD